MAFDPIANGATVASPAPSAGVTLPTNSPSTSTFDPIANGATPVSQGSAGLANPFGTSTVPDASFSMPTQPNADGTMPNPFTSATNTNNAEQPGFIDSLVTPLADTITQGLRLPVGAAMQGIGALTGNKFLQTRGATLTGTQPINDPFGNPITAPGYGADGKPLSLPAATLQGAAAGATVAPYLLGAGEAAPVVDAGEAAVTDALPIAGKTLLRTIGEGVGTGALLGGANNFGASASQAVNSGTSLPQALPGIAGSTALGAAGGALTGGVLSGVMGKLGGAGINEAPLGTANRTAQDINTISDAIAPGMTKGETQSAISEGRLARTSQSQGAISQHVFGQAPDAVTQSAEVQRAATAIQQNIPDAAKMSDAQLYSAAGQQVTSQANALRPILQSIPVNIDTLGQAQDAWSAIKTQQVKDVGASFDNMPGAAKMQSDFQNVMDSLNRGSTDPATGKFQPATTNNMNDLWNARIAYDQSVPANVKEATPLSSDALQYKKAMWLQNRSILNNVINASTDSLPKGSQQAFTAMSDMYTAQENILAKAPKPSTGGAGLIGHGGKISGSTLLKYGGAVAAGWIGNGIINKLTGLP